MLSNRFHEKWVMPLLALLLCCNGAFAQCPLTKSASFAMVQQGLPSLERLQPTDFLLNLNDTLDYTGLSLDKNHFLCIDVGVQEILLSGVDATGTAFSCQEFVWVYDSVLLCSKEIQNPVAVAGKIFTEKYQTVSNIAIGLSNGTANYFQGTDERGAFFFEDFDIENYELTPINSFDNNIRNGVSTYDVLLLQKHILGLRSLGSPYKLIAADLNSSGDITAYDMLLLRQMILSVIEVFPNTPSWKFVDANYEFENPKNPFKEDFPTSITLNMENLGPQLDNRFIAIKLGDMNNSVKLEGRALGRALSSKGEPVFSIKNQSIRKGELVSIPFFPTTEMDIEGFQFGLKYNEEKLAFVRVAGEFDLSEEDYFHQDGTINFSWTNAYGTRINTGDSPIILNFIAKSDGQLSNEIQLTNQYLSPEIYTAESGILPFNWTWGNDSEVADFQVINNYPNPFSERTSIAFSLPKNSKVSIKIMDANGKILTTQQQDFSAGLQSFTIDEKFPAAGIYFYQLESQFGITTGRMSFIGK